MHSLRKVKAFLPRLHLEVTIGAATAVAVSAALFLGTACFGASLDALSLGSSVATHWHVHKLVTYTFFHEDLGLLLLSTAVFWLFAGGLERSLGTVRFCYLLLLFSCWTGLLHTLLELLLYEPGAGSQVRGFLPVTFSAVGMMARHSRVRRFLLFGVNVPMALLPWLLLTLALVVPGSSFLCNLIAVAVGDIYARGWCLVCQLSEARAALLDRKLPFRLWRRLGGSLYVPASAEERRAALQTPIKPIPGSYPVQAYAPVSSLPSPHTPEMHSQSFEGWRNSPCSHGHGHSHGHSAAHQMPSPSAWGVPAGHTHSTPPALFPGYPASCPLSTINPGGRPPGGSNARVPEVTVPVGSAAVAQQGQAVWSPAGPVVR